MSGPEIDDNMTIGDMLDEADRCSQPTRIERIESEHHERGLYAEQGQAMRRLIYWGIEAIVAAIRERPS